MFEKSGRYWKIQVVPNTEKIAGKHIVHIRSGPTKNIRANSAECFNLFFTDDILNEI